MKDHSIMKQAGHQAKRRLMGSTRMKALRNDMQINLEETNKRAAEIRESLLDVNHGISSSLTEILDRQKNSGTIVLKEDTAITKIFSGLKLYMDPRDLAVFPHIALDAIWEHRITDAWLKIVREEDTIADIGANFGYYGALAAQRTNPKKSKILFFEPNPYLIGYINKTLSVNWLHEQSVIENLAISDVAADLTLHLLEDYVGSSSLHSAGQVNKLMGKKMHAKTQEKIKVKAISLDEYCKMNKIDKIDLIKMDIEGFEEQAYRGMRKIVKASPEITMFVEFTAGAYEQPKKFFQTMLEDFGYLYRIEEDGYTSIVDSPSYEELIQDESDWVMFIFSKRANIATRIR